MNTIMLYDLLDEYISNFHGSNNTKYNVQLQIKKIKTYFRNQSILLLDTSTIQTYINYLYIVELLSDSTIFTMYKRLNTILNYAVDYGYINKNPCKKVNVKRVYYVRRELDYSKKSLKMILKTFKNTKLYAFVYVDLHTRS